jgi:numb-like protein
MCNSECQTINRQICLERKQKRDKDVVQTVTVTYSNDKTSFTRMGSFRQTRLTDKTINR